MELLNPKLTVQNTDQNFWLIRMEHAFSEHERIDVQLKMPRTDASLSATQGAVVQTAIAYLQKLLPSNPA